MLEYKHLSDYLVNKIENISPSLLWDDMRSEEVTVDHIKPHEPFYDFAWAWRSQTMTVKITRIDKCLHQLNTHVIFQPTVHKSCFLLLQDGFTSSGVYTINPDGGKPMQVLCDMTTDGGGWTVFQRRLDGSVDFYLGWASYKNGFGNLTGEFWLGNDNLHRLTAANDDMLRVDLEDFDNNTRYAEYTTFKVADESDKYRLSIGGYSGTAGDSMTSGQSTK